MTRKAKEVELETTAKQGSKGCNMSQQGSLVGQSLGQQGRGHCKNRHRQKLGVSLSHVIASLKPQDACHGNRVCGEVGGGLPSCE